MIKQGLSDEQTNTPQPDMGIGLYSFRFKPQHINLIMEALFEFSGRPFKVIDEVVTALELQINHYNQEAKKVVEEENIPQKKPTKKPSK